ncbi:hypothetical protein P5G51_010295 [Virgibacillus sp. 179-BFC.A HS]|uniref:Spo0E like sporulation regulatory protein n=1 Tax=Tigheibacillus jepli TaxID=3035914 RepID=A0ABU5CJR7_9BACI|nr:hypothetical protein [Virgibacillus sp. 179-BFC.A HS]MDY0405730.1 hypothetical protein [Virgibacillus sp. 179-BFC.A HS]
MGLAAKNEMQYFEFGMTNDELAESLIRLNHKFRMAEQKLTVKTDIEIMTHYHCTQNELIFLRDMLERYKHIK